MRLDWAQLRAWVREAGALAQEAQGRVQARRKADGSHVTEADHQVEAYLRERLRGSLPAAGFIGEEGGDWGRAEEWVWAVDPIDGTTNYVRGLPLWGVSVGLLRVWEPYAGLVYLPATREFFWGGVGQGAWRGEQRLAAPPSRVPDDYDLYAIGSEMWDSFALGLPGKPRTLGTAAGHLAYVASGAFRAGLFLGVHLWDLAAGLAIARAAGCVASDLNGCRLQLAGLADGGTNTEPLIVAAPDVARQVREQLVGRLD